MTFYTKLLVLIFLIISVSSYSQLEYKDYANCQKKTYRLNKIRSLTGADGDYKFAIEYLKQDSIEADFEFYLSKSLFTYVVYGKQKAYKYLIQNKIADEELYSAKLWLALMTDNTIEYELLKQEYKKLYPDSNFLLKMNIKEYLINNKSNVFDRNDKKEQQIFLAIDSLISHNKLSNFDVVFFAIAKLDIKKNIIFDKKNNKVKRELRKIAKMYPNEIWQPYLKFALAEDTILIERYGLKGVANPTRKEMDNWTAFSDFLANNPFFDKTKISDNYLGFSIFDYPQIEDEKELKIALHAMDKLIDKYPGIISLKNTKLLMIKIFKDIFSSKQEMSKYYLSTLIDLFEYNGDSGILLQYIIPQYEYDEELLVELFSNLEKQDLSSIKKQLELSLKNEPKHQNLIKFKEIFEKFEQN